MYGQFKRISNSYEGVLTGKGLTYGGSLVRTEATGYGLVYLVQAMLKAKNKSFDGQRVVISGSGNVAVYAAEKATALGAKVISLSDSSGYIYDEDGVDLDAIKELKFTRRERLSQYTTYRPNAQYTAGNGIWSIPCDIALPCATQNELLLDDAKELIKNGCYAVGEGANMPSSLEAVEAFLANNVLFAPGKAANAGGVATSALEMSQNSQRLSWSFYEVDQKLQNIMLNIYSQIEECALKYNKKDNFVVGSNIAGFLKVSEAMIAQGIV